jgi:8-oxo-dGTP pyrophosphatase MutT (NUDIX family)
MWKQKYYSLSVPMKPGKVRAIAICVIRKRDAIFVFEGHDSIKGETFYRPLGGTIEFGEHSCQTILRELREEINAEIKNLKYLGALENIFIHEGQAGHEIILVYEGEFADPSIYTKEMLLGKEDDGGLFKALWKPLEDFTNGKAPLYPVGLLELILG